MKLIFHKEIRKFSNLFFSTNYGTTQMILYKKGRDYMVINLNFTLSSVDADRLLRYKEKDKCEHSSTNDYAKKLLEDELFKKCFY